MLKVSLPGSKSWINRFLIMSVFAKGSSSFVGGNSCDDVCHMMEALKQLGHRIDCHGDQTVITPGEWKQGTVYAGEAGTVGRFLTPICGWLGKSRLDMTAQLMARPLEEGMQSIRAAGGSVEKDDKGFIFETAMKGEEFEVSPKATSQFLSGFLMLAAGIQGSVKLNGEIPASAYVTLTKNIIELFGVQVSHDDSSYSFSSAPVGVEARSEVDLSGASALLVALCLLKREALLEGWDAATVQAEGLLPEILIRSGVKLELCDKGLTYYGGDFKKLELDCKDVPDAVPALVALASSGSETSVFSNFDYLSTKESNRTERIMEMGKAAGLKFEFDGNILKVSPSKLHACSLDGGDDHRMAMYGLLLRLCQNEIDVSGVHSLSKSFPDFEKKIQLIQSA
jgi:3-phosphoshikimate 1-carboxyvinyltransferase